jgi:hypothetical protein
VEQVAYTVPTFNLLADVATCAVPRVVAMPPGVVRIVAQVCNLAWGMRVNVAGTGGTGLPGVPIACLTLLLPKGADIRGPQDTVSNDMVEVPRGTGRWYGVYAVDDIGRGFANEHRVALLLAVAGAWAPPYP